MKELLKKIFNKINCKSSESCSENLSQADVNGIPGYLVYPNDPLSQRMFGSKIQEVCDRRCGYRFMLYTDIADPSPEIRQQTPPFDINETHIFRKPDSHSFCSVSIMKSPSVKTSNLRGWVESTDQIGMMFGDMTPFLNLPSGLSNGEYQRVKMHDLGQCAAYNKLHGFEETHVYCHVFYLGDTLYKKFILLEGRMHLPHRFRSAAAHGHSTSRTGVRLLLSGRVVATFQIEQLSSLFGSIQYGYGK